MRHLYGEIEVAIKWADYRAEVTFTVFVPGKITPSIGHKILI